MPRVTNTLGLPIPIVRAALASLNGYDREGSKYSITGLLDPPRKPAILAEHFPELVEDVSDVIYRLLGSALHSLCEWACLDPDPTKLEGDWVYDGDLSLDGWVIEQRFHTTVAGQSVSCKVDFYDTNTRTLWDLKCTSVWGAVFDRGEWADQLNGSRPMLVDNDLPDPEHLRIVGVWRDWQKSRAGGKNYPDKQITNLSKERWTLDQARDFLTERVTAHEAAATELPLCTDDERWKGYDRQAGQTVYRRCDSYCAARPWCEQAQA